MPLNMANSIAGMASGLLGLHGDSSRFLVVFDDGKYDLGSWSKVGGLRSPMTRSNTGAETATRCGRSRA